jgi:hypothetical protein
LKARGFLEEGPSKGIEAMSGKACVLMEFDMKTDWETPSEDQKRPRVFFLVSVSG